MFQDAERFQMGEGVCCFRVSHCHCGESVAGLADVAVGAAHETPLQKFFVFSRQIKDFRPAFFRFILYRVFCFLLRFGALGYRFPGY